MEDSPNLPNFSPAKLSHYMVDTGADIIVIGKTDYNEAQDELLQSSRTILSGTSQTPLEVLGKFQANLRHNNRETQDVWIIM